MPKPTFFTNTPEKDVIRGIICKQFDAWLANKQTATFNGLASDQWIVEKKVAAIAREQGKKINHNNFEIKWGRVWHKFPWFCRQPSSINFTNHTGMPNGFFRYIQEENIPTFSWADYCGTPLKKEIKAFKGAIRLGDVIYVTFSLNPRFKKSIDKKCLAVLEHGKNCWQDCADNLTEVLENYIREKVGNNFKRILFSFYITNAGKRGQTPMITVGWHFQKNSNLGKVSH